MKRFFIITVSAVLMLGAFASCAHDDDRYALLAEVYDIDLVKDEVVFVDSTGNLWAERGVEDWEIGDIAALLMDGQHTDSIYDDEIVSARYARAHDKRDWRREMG